MLKAIRRFFHRPPDQVIGSIDDPLLLRWYVIPMNMWFNIYLHKFMRSDDDRALHDHPWFNVSLPLTEGYYEHLPYRGNPQETIKFERRPWRLYFRNAELPHRIELHTKLIWRDDGLDLLEKPVWSLFLTGRKVRSWGFYCPKGWVPWRDFVTLTPHGNQVGAGCDVQIPQEENRS
jgi:hypothetical protein